MNTAINTNINLRNQLVMDYMPLVRSIASRYRIPTVPREDLEQEGAQQLHLNPSYVRQTLCEAIQSVRKLLRPIL